MATQPKISLVLADVDGTLVTEEKVLTERAQASIKAMRAAGIRFAITSGRPPRGMEMLIDVLDLDTPIAGFNGGMFVRRDLSILEQKALPPDVAQKGNGVAADPNFSNVTEAHFSAADLAKLGPVDLVWTSQNYHDLHLARFKLDVVAFDKAIYADLKPGGVFFIEDHAAKDGSGLDAPDKLHRIDEAVVKQEVESAGFKLVGESNILRNPADDRTLLVFNPAIRGHTDQFLLKFQKPR